jgi:hypothetical protein
MTSLETLAEKNPHGTRVRYMTGCKCMLCRAANSRYETERALARKNGDWNGVVPAVRARAHLKKLARRGIGRRLISQITDLPHSTLHAIKTGRKTNIRARTERRILTVTEEARGDKTLVMAAPVWAQINRLLREGFTQTELARRLGSRAKVPALQLNGRVVTARNAMRVEKLHATVMAGSGIRGRQPILRSVAQGYKVSTIDSHEHTGPVGQRTPNALNPESERRDPKTLDFLRPIPQGNSTEEP